MGGILGFRSFGLPALVAIGLLGCPGGSRSLGQEPRIPGAVTSCPSWLKSGAPFDMDEFFARPPAAKDAAPLYFEAFAEFTPAADACLTEKMRNPLADDRQSRIRAHWNVLFDRPEEFDRRAADALVAELHDGFRKLAGAQRRPNCVFDVGLSDEALLPHVVAARTVVEAICLRIARDAEKGNLERAIPDLEMILRLSRDVRPRGPLVVQVATVTFDGNGLLVALPRILRSPGLKARHCERLAAILRDHGTNGQDRFATGSKGEYVMQRTFLRACQERRLAQAGPDGRATDVLISITDAARMVARRAEDASRGETPLGPQEIRVVEALLRGHGPAWADERRALDELARSMSAPDPGRCADRVRRFQELKAKYLGGRVPDSLFVAQLSIPPYDTVAQSLARAEAYQRGSLALVALRHAQLSGGPDAPSLAAACKGIGLPAVPTDPFAGAPLKTAVIGGEPVVYSIGPDEVDDQALVDAQLGRNPNGDILFRLPVPDAGRR